MQPPPISTIDQQFLQAQQLIQAGRPNDALPLILTALNKDPNSTDALRLFGFVYLRLDDAPRAMETLQQAIGLDPEDDGSHHLLATAHLHQKSADLTSAAFHADEALRLAPNDSDHHALKARIFVFQEAWENVLTWADKGLTLDPEDTDCLNLRAHALTHLGRFEAARETLSETLRQAPEDDQSHANQGWSLLHQNQPREALKHFKESLRLQPGNEWAKAGLVEALKAKNPFYRLLLAFFLWTARLSPRARIGVIIGGVLGFHIFTNTANHVPALKPWVLPITTLYLLFVALTWIAIPLFNLLLRLSPSGRHALSDRQRVGSNLFGLALLSVLAVPASLFTAYLITQDPQWLGRTVQFGLLFGLILLPTSSLLTLGAGPAFRRRAFVMAGIALAAIASIALELTGHPASATLYRLSLYSNLATLWWFGLSSTRRSRRA